MYLCLGEWDGAERGLAWERVFLYNVATTQGFAPPGYGNLWLDLRQAYHIDMPHGTQPEFMLGQFKSSIQSPFAGRDKIMSCRMRDLALRTKMTCFPLLPSHLVWTLCNKGKGKKKTFELRSPPFCGPFSVSVNLFHFCTDWPPAEVLNCATCFWPPYYEQHQDK